MIIEVVSDLFPEFILCPVCGETKFETRQIEGASEEIRCLECDSVIQVD